MTHLISRSYRSLYPPAAPHHPNFPNTLPRSDTCFSPSPNERCILSSHAQRRLSSGARTLATISSRPYQCTGGMRITNRRSPLSPLATSQRTESWMRKSSSSPTKKSPARFQYIFTERMCWWCWWQWGPARTAELKCRKLVALAKMKVPAEYMWGLAFRRSWVDLHCYCYCYYCYHMVRVGKGDKRQLALLDGNLTS
ncbi:hypothetical protein I7I48_09756 [Histoplasma ohiense]|nr:hypothetical protein I7I48_09756 [Histoplasma ohiense (nom. inval.)]